MIPIGYESLLLKQATTLWSKCQSKENDNGKVRGADERLGYEFPGSRPIGELEEVERQSTDTMDRIYCEIT